MFRKCSASTLTNKALTDLLQECMLPRGLLLTVPEMEELVWYGLVWSSPAACRWQADKLKKSEKI